MTANDSPEITVLYFAGASTATGLTSQQIRLPSTSSSSHESKSFSLSSLPQLLASLHPNTNLDKILETCQWSVDAEMVDDIDGVVLKGGEEVAVIPPVSGG